MKRAINIQDFLKKFNDEYKFLYDSNGTVCGEKEAVKAFDDFVKQHGDFISSDREAAAFMFALDSMSG